MKRQSVNEMKCARPLSLNSVVRYKTPQSWSQRKPPDILEHVVLQAQSWANHRDDLHSLIRGYHFIDSMVRRDHFTDKAVNPARRNTIAPYLGTCALP